MFLGQQSYILMVKKHHVAQRLQNLKTKKPEVDKGGHYGYVTASWIRVTVHCIYWGLCSKSNLRLHSIGGLSIYAFIMLRPSSWLLMVYLQWSWRLRDRQCNSESDSSTANDESNLTSDMTSHKRSQVMI